MGKQSFQDLIRINRRTLYKGGIPSYLLTLYIQGKRRPSFKTAQKIAALLDMPVTALPWSRLEVNNPNK